MDILLLINLATAIRIKRLNLIIPLSVVNVKRVRVYLSYIKIPSFQKLLDSPCGLNTKAIHIEGAKFHLGGGLDRVWAWQGFLLELLSQLPCLLLLVLDWVVGQPVNNPLASRMSLVEVASVLPSSFVFAWLLVHSVDPWQKNEWLRGKLSIQGD